MENSRAYRIATDGRSIYIYLFLLIRFFFYIFNLLLLCCHSIIFDFLPLLG